MGARRLGNQELGQAPHPNQPEQPEQIARNDEFVPRRRPANIPERVVEIYQDMRRELQRQGRTPLERVRTIAELRDELNALDPDTIRIPDATVAAGRRYRSHIQGQVLSSLEAFGNATINQAGVDTVLDIQNNQYGPNRDIRILNHQFLANAAAANGGNPVQVFCELEREHLTEEIQGLQDILRRLGQDHNSYWHLARHLSKHQATLDLSNRILDPRNPINNIEGFLDERSRTAGQEMQRLFGMLRQDAQRNAPGFIQLQQNIGTTEGIMEGTRNLYQLLQPEIIRRRNAPPPVLV